MGHIQIKPEPTDSRINNIKGDGSLSYNNTDYETYRPTLKNGCVLVLPDGTTASWMRSNHYHSLSGMKHSRIESLPIEFGDFMILCGCLYRAKGSDSIIEIRE